MQTGLKTPEQIQAMREGGKTLATIYRDLKTYVRAGMSELEVDAWVAQEIKRHGAIATYKTSEVNFPNVICISTKGDVVSFDLVIAYKGMKTDAAFTMVIDEQPTGIKKHLLNVTERSLYAGIDAIKGPVYTGDIGAAVEQVLTTGKLGIVRDLVGHGVGLEMHMDPEIPNYGRKGTGVLLKPGDTIAIEPMATLGGEKISTDTQGDGWTIRTRDGSLAAHFEHTVLVTENGAEILTQL